MNDRDFAERKSRVIQAELLGPKGWWYLSFSSPEGWKGAALVEAHGIATAIHRAYELGINPGGSVIGEHMPDNELPPRDYLNKLLSFEELKSAFEKIMDLKGNLVNERRTH